MSRAPLLALFLFILPLAALAQAKTLSVAVPSDVYQDYRLFLAGRAPLTIKDFSGEHSRRDVVEVVLFQQALKLGGYPTAINFRQVDSAQRTLRLLQTGNVQASATTFFANDLNNYSQVLASAVVIDKGEFVVGLYLNDTHPLLKKAQITQAEVKKLTLVSNKQWALDWATLQQLNFNKLISTAKWPGQVKMVAAGRADGLLAPFQSTNNMQLAAFKKRLLPLPGYKVALSDTRHFAVSNKGEGHHQLIEALARGVAELRSSGRLHQAYQQAGFFNPKVKDWQLLQP